MTQLGEAITRYHKLIQTEPFRDLGWAQELKDKMLAANLRDGASSLCPFLRPHFLVRRQYAALAKAAESLCASIDRVLQMALANPALLGRMGLLPAEKMLALLDPGYSFLTVTSLLDTFMNGGGSPHFVGHHSDSAPTLAYSAALSDLFYDCPPVKQFRRQYNLAKLGGTKQLVSSLAAAYKQFGGKRKPRVGVLEFRQAFQTAEGADYWLLKELLLSHGLEAEIVSPDALEYRNGILRQGTFAMDVVFRRVRVHDFLLRFDLTHPLVRAYRDRAVCVVNSFRSELAQKRTIFALLTDEALTAGFPAAERRVIQEYVPWTRAVAPGKTKYGDKTVDLMEFVLKNRERLVLKPNDSGGEEHVLQGWNTDASRWERALKQAARTPMVVQERVAPEKLVFPLLRDNTLEMRELQVDVHPHASLGKVQGCSTWLSDVTNGGFSSVAGLAPTFILEPRS
jgi:hypothetical protein